jgi:FkbM family methyltransferase
VLQRAYCGQPFWKHTEAVYCRLSCFYELIKSHINLMEHSRKWVIREVTKKSVNRALGQVGLELGRTRSFHQDMRDSLVHLRARGLRPATVLDVGVGEGTFDLYEVFPEATHVLVEPLSEFQEAIAAIQESYRALYVPAAAGARAGRMEIFVKPHLEGSSAFLEQAGGSVLGAARQVNVVALDDVVAEHHLQGPFLLKVDVEGAELQVLAGASKVLEEAEVVILEVTFLPKLQGAPAFADIFRGMDQLGFAVYDVFDLQLRPTDGALFQANMTFVKAGSPLRSRQEWWIDASGKVVAQTVRN